MNDLGYIKDPMVWNLWLCPLKRRNADGGNECAYLFCNEPVIKIGNVWGPTESDREVRYPSHEAILADGWKVD